MGIVLIQRFLFIPIYYFRSRSRESIWRSTWHSTCQPTSDSTTSGLLVLNLFKRLSSIRSTLELRIRWFRSACTSYWPLAVATIHEYSKHQTAWVHNACYSEPACMAPKRWFLLRIRVNMISTTVIQAARLDRGISAASAYVPRRCSFRSRNVSG